MKLRSWPETPKPVGSMFHKWHFGHWRKSLRTD